MVAILENVYLYLDLDIEVTLVLMLTYCPNLG